MNNKYKIDVKLFEKFLELTDDILLVTNLTGDICYFNDKAPKNLGFSMEELHNKNFFELLTDRAKKENAQVLNDFLTEKTSLSETAEVFCGNGLVKYFDFNAIFNGDFIVVSAKDVSDRISLQVELETLSYKDSLTGLYNRNYFVEVIPSYKSLESLPLSITVLDINDLKLVNDAFGHLLGDKAIVKLAEIIKNNIPKRAHAMRIGGDEFVIVIPNVTSLEVTNMENSIKSTLLSEKISEVHLTVALGTYIIKNLNGFDNGYNIADTRMYRAKQLIKQNQNFGILDDIMTRLFVISPLDKEVSEGVRDACVVIGRQLGFKPEKINQLALLGYYHNIGKIILDKSLLNRLDINDDEKAEYMEFADKSYSLFSSSKELFSIANDAGLVFENYYSSDKPNSLSNEEIPMFARILKIAIAENRLEMKNYTRPQILEYLNKYKGTKYDPYLVDIVTRLV